MTSFCGMRVWRWLVSASVLLGVSNCASPSGRVRFQGIAGARVVHPENVVEAPAIPRAAQKIGHVSVFCRDAVALGRFERRRLVDIDCSEARLRSLLREAAAAKGGDVLVGTACERGSCLHCAADVARWPAPAFESAPSPRDFSAASEAGILVSFSPIDGASVLRRERPLSTVRELAEPSPAIELVGSLRAECDHCDERLVRRALLVSAARIGASAVVGPRCVHDGERTDCVAEAASSRVD